MAITGKGLALETGVKLITPSKAARLAGAAGDSAGDQAPISGPELPHKTTQHGVLLRRPRSLHFPPPAPAPSHALAVSQSGRLSAAFGVLFFAHGGFTFWVLSVLVRLGLFSILVSVCLSLSLSLLCHYGTTYLPNRKWARIVIES